MLAGHQREHPVDGELGRVTQVLVEAEREPGAVDPRGRPLEREVAADVERDLRRDRRLDRRTRDLAVPLTRMTIAGREERAVDRDRNEERRPADELLAVDVAAGGPRRACRVSTWLSWRHPEHPEKGRELDRASERPPNAAVELPPNHVPARKRGSPVRGLNLVDPHHERLACAGAADLDRPGERMALVLGLVARREPLRHGHVPTGVRGREAHRVPGVDRQHRLEVAGEVAVEDTGVQSQLVDGH